MFLITGFEPFISSEGVVLEQNPTQEIAQSLGRTRSDVDALVLPVSFKRTPRYFLDALDRFRPRVWIGLGYAPHRTTIDIETIALNVEFSTRPDNDGIQPKGRPVVTDSPLALATTVDIDLAIRHLDHNSVRAQRSNHAGTFLCNQVFYLGCHREQKKCGLESATFIHVPPMESYSQFESGLLSWLDELAQNHR